MNDNTPTLGSLMRTLRTRNGWTLQEMSDRTGIPRSTLAKVEHDRLTLGYDKLLQISQRLKMRMSELFAAAGDESEARTMTRRSIGTLENAVRVDTRNYEYFFLCPDLRKKRLVPLFARIRARTLEEFGELIRHPGEEFLYVLEGRVEVHTEVYETVTLNPGQCSYIDSTMGHAYVLAPGCDSAVAVGGCTSAEEELYDTLNKHELGASRPTTRISPEVVAKRPKKTARPKVRRR